MGSFKKRSFRFQWTLYASNRWSSLHFHSIHPFERALMIYLNFSDKKYYKKTLSSVVRTVQFLGEPIRFDSMFSPSTCVAACHNVSNSYPSRIVWHMVCATIPNILSIILQMALEKGLQISPLIENINIILIDVSAMTKNFSTDFAISYESFGQFT